MQTPSYLGCNSGCNTLQGNIRQYTTINNIKWAK
nr:MAG TPA: hypothetical protein [Caudoviricetes sp.]